MTKNKGIIVSHPTGNANVRAALSGFLHAHLLLKFYTCIACKTNSVFDLVSGLPGFGEINRRRFDKELDSFIETSPFKEMMRLLAIKTGMDSLILHEKGIFSVDNVYRSLDKFVARKLKGNVSDLISAVYAYEDGAKNTFEIAKNKNIRCFYDLPIGYWKSARILMQNEIEKRPDWSETMMGFNDSAYKTGLKDQELEMADRIFVASSFTAETLKEFKGNLNPVSIIPYGFPAVANPKKYDDLKERPLKLLFVGGLSQRKGLADIFDSVSEFGTRVELTIIGRPPGNEVKALKNGLDKHKWIPSLPHSEILKYMYDSDVLLFPSLFEGFGLVITESMSQGTPVITTNRTAGPDFITHNENGWIIDAGNPHSISAMLQEIIENPELVEKNGTQARMKAMDRPWVKYGQELANEVLSYI